MEWSSLHQSAVQTITSIIAKLHERGVTITVDHGIDHICYRCPSDQHYRALSMLLSEHAHLLHESMIDGRLVSIRKLTTAFLVQSRSIPCIELSAPKQNNTHPEGREHIEIVVTDLDVFAREYGHLITERKGFMKTYNRDLEIEFPRVRADGGQRAVKFHEQSIADVIDYEKTIL